MSNEIQNSDGIQCPYCECVMEPVVGSDYSKESHETQCIYCFKMFTLQCCTNRSNFVKKIAWETRPVKKIKVAPLYAERDIEDLDVGGYYSKHVSAMGAEELHSKTDIAAELAHRDKIIDGLLRTLDGCFEAIEEARDRGLL